MEKSFDQDRFAGIFNTLASELERECGGLVHLVKIIGPRVSYVAGRVPEDMPVGTPQRVMLNEEWALLIYGRPLEPSKIVTLFKGNNV